MTDRQTHTTERKFLMFCRETVEMPKPWLGVIVIADIDPAQVVDIVTGDTQDELSEEFQLWLQAPRSAGRQKLSAAMNGTGYATSAGI